MDKLHTTSTGEERYLVPLFLSFIPLSPRHHPFQSSLTWCLLCLLILLLCSWLFNQLIHEGELCTATNGMRIKLFLAQMDSWLRRPSPLPHLPAHAPFIMENLLPVQQAAALLSLDHGNKQYERLLGSNGSTLSSFFHPLNALQLHRLISQYRMDSIGTHPSAPALCKLAEAAAKQHPTLTLELDASQLLPLPVQLD